MVLTRLSDGTEVLVRDIRPADKALLAAGHARLSEASRFRRFLSPKPSLSAAELRYLTEVDGVDHYAAVAVLADRWDGDIIAVARWVRLAHEPSGAEAAIVVCDDYQSKGLGTALARLLADTARRRGIARIHASIHADNVRALKLMGVIAARLDGSGPSFGVRDLTAELAA
jgi:GNAT superfamily N-acetyltransferase